MCSSQRFSLTPRQSRNASLVLIAVNFVLASPSLYLFENNHRGVCLVGQETMRSLFVKVYYRYGAVLVQRTLAWGWGGRGVECEKEGVDKTTATERKRERERERERERGGGGGRGEERDKVEKERWSQYNYTEGIGKKMRNHIAVKLGHRALTLRYYIFTDNHDRQYCVTKALFDSGLIRENYI